MKSIFGEDHIVATLARRMENPGFDSDGRPDAFDRLVEREGYEAASRIWMRACESFDWKHAPEEFGDGPPASVVEY